MSVPWNWKQTVKRALSRPAIEWCRWWPSLAAISLMRRVVGMQLTPLEIWTIVRALRRRRRCAFLVFGLGRDSLFWTRVNRGGRTVFIEDSQEWFEEVTRRHPSLEAYLVDYGTTRAQWRDLLVTPGSLAMRLPEPVEQQRWDAVLVDAPAGFLDTTPGRMRSIALARRLARAPGDIFVHDCDREVERVYCDRLLGADNLVREVNLLRHYSQTM